MRLTTLLSLIFLSTVMALAGARHNIVSNVDGDVNADGDVTIADVNVVIDAILRGVPNMNCDVNKDGDITIADVNLLIDIILRGPQIHNVDRGMYMGVMGFNQTLTTKPIAYLDSTSLPEFNEFVNSLSTQPGRLLYYSVDNALTALSTASHPENLQNVAIVTFTQGLDQGSLMMTDKYETEAEYAAELKDRIDNVRVYGRQVKAYTVGLLDSENLIDEAQFRSNLYALSSDSTKAMEVSNIAEVNTKFQIIADDLVSRNMSETLTLIFPGVGTGTRIRFTLDEVNNNVDDSQVYIEGTFSLKTRSLTNIVYHGLTCTSGDSIAASSVDGMFVTMVFDGIQLDSEDRIVKNNIQEWYWVEDQNAWEPSTEFSASNLPDVESTYSSALVMVLLDCSSVVNDNFADLQNAANSFIERMMNYNTIPGRYTVNGVTFQMVAIDGGTFTMGAENSSYADPDETPAHEVTLSPYSIGQTEVTQELWKAVMVGNPSSFTGDLKRPVEQVSWEDCQEFISRLNAITGKNFRLPTEAEWEYAARGANKSRGTAYAGGDIADDVAWNVFNSYAVGTASPDFGTHAVATKHGNEMNLYDMSGNVFEWCSDWYGPYTEEAQTNPAGPESGQRRVTRGGGWQSPHDDCRVTFRRSEVPSTRNYTLGFRLAL